MPYLRASSLFVSIHAPRVGRDRRQSAVRGVAAVSIHAPRVGRDRKSCPPGYRLRVFQSTRPAWGATLGTVFSIMPWTVSIHAPRVGRDAAMIRIQFATAIGVSIHAPRVGRDRRRQLHPLAIRSQVSIHAPRVGRDVRAGANRPNERCFNPRAPRGARPPPLASILPVSHVSIHAPRVGRDHCEQIRRPSGCGFNPRAPRGARPRRHGCDSVGMFQSTRPAWGATSSQAALA